MPSVARRDRPPEVVGFRRRKELPGVELRTVSDARGAWRCYSADFELMAPISWCGEVGYRGRKYAVEPGMLFCSEPGEVFGACRVVRAGALRVLTIEAQVLREYAAEDEPSAARLELRPCTRMSERLRSKLSALCGAVAPESSRLDLEAAFRDFMTALRVEVVEQDAPLAPARAAGSGSLVDDLRDRLLEATAHNVGLATLVEETRFSRFQALRAFKQRFGLPPHSYHLNVRLALAKKALRDGMTPAQAAAEFGFVDQSHLTRHFKRLTGITPAQYARVGSGANHSNGV